ncbi:MAG: DUF523 and DUF1722 domain-containing protein [Thermodesulfovibrionales bacterium]|nr:DUF523 and DUF1722 domain-containing protein [Thermodesulfovibrionales bacterium]
MDKIKIGISSCLLGEPVRYDGNHKLDSYLKFTLGRFVEWYPVCPEVECGLGVPREAMRLVGDVENPRLITINSGIDHTDMMKTWIGQRLKEIEAEGLCGFVFKSRSPSSGLRDVKVYNEKGIPYKKSSGLFAREFVRRFPILPVEDDSRLNDPLLRENFIERLFVYKRWLDTVKNGITSHKLVEFHTSVKLLLLAHNPACYKELGSLVANHSDRDVTTLSDEYIHKLMEGIKRPATVKKNTNVLQHIMGYFKKHLDTDDKVEISDLITSYYNGYIPLIVPITLLNHYIRKYDITYLKKQIYLNPYPLELMLRNHV